MNVYIKKLKTITGTQSASGRVSLISVFLVHSALSISEINLSIAEVNFLFPRFFCFELNQLMFS